MKPRYLGAVGALSLALAGFAVPAVSQAEGDCGVNFFWNTATNQCQFCDPATSFWNYDTNVCILTDATPYVDPILGPAGPIGVGPDPIVGPVGPVGVGPDPIVGPVGPVGVGPNPVVGPVGPVGIGRR